MVEKSHVVQVLKLSLQEADEVAERLNQSSRHKQEVLMRAQHARVAAEV